MADNQQEDDELIMVDPTQDTINLWTSLIDDTSANSMKVHAENQLEVNLFKNGGAIKKGQHVINKRDARKRIKTSLESSGFNQEQIKTAIENYTQSAEFMDLPIDRVDSRSTFMFDVDAEGWITAVELERYGLLKKVEDADFNRSVFEQAREVCRMNEYQKDFSVEFESRKKNSVPVEAKSNITYRVERGNEKEKQSELRERSKNLDKEKEREKDKERERERLNFENKKVQDNKENREINKDKQKSRKPLAIDSLRSSSPKPSDKIKKHKYLEDLEEGEVYNREEKEKEEMLHKNQAPYSTTRYKSKHKDDYVVTFSFYSGPNANSKNVPSTPSQVSTSTTSYPEKRAPSPKRFNNNNNNNNNNNSFRRDRDFEPENIRPNRPPRKDICFTAQDLRPNNPPRRNIGFVAADIRAVKQRPTPVSNPPVVIEIDDCEEIPPKPQKPKKAQKQPAAFLVIDSDEQDDNKDNEDEERIFGPLLSPDINTNRNYLSSDDSDMELGSGEKIADKLKMHRFFQDEYNHRLQGPLANLNTIAGLSSTLPSSKEAIPQLPHFIPRQQQLQHFHDPIILHPLHAQQRQPHLQPIPHPDMQPRPHPHLHPRPRVHPLHEMHLPPMQGSFSLIHQEPDFYPEDLGPFPGPRGAIPYEGSFPHHPGYGQPGPVPRRSLFPQRPTNPLIEKFGAGGHNFQEYDINFRNNAVPFTDRELGMRILQKIPHNKMTGEQIMRDGDEEYTVGSDSPEICEQEPGEVLIGRHKSPLRL